MPCRRHNVSLVGLSVCPGLGLGHNRYNNNQYYHIDYTAKLQTQYRRDTSIKADQSKPSHISSDIANSTFFYIRTYLFVLGEN